MAETGSGKTLYEAIVALQEGAELAEYAANRVEGGNVEALRSEAEQLRRHAESIRRMIEERAITTIA